MALLLGRVLYHAPVIRPSRLTCIAFVVTKFAGNIIHNILFQAEVLSIADAVGRARGWGGFTQNLTEWLTINKRYGNWQTSLLCRPTGLCGLLVIEERNLRNSATSRENLRDSGTFESAGSIWPL